ncbi:MAG: cell division protein FtsQ [Paraburkholderia sp.]|nr:MAG: cell division protein FtsQ [Paraburkholderia sp.]
MSETVAQSRGRPAAGSPRVAEPERAHRPMAACVSALLAGAFVLGIASLITHAKTDPASRLGDTAAWRSGEAMRRIDRAIDVPYAATLRRVSAALRYRVLGDLGSQVREGCPGWLFYADGLQPAPSQDETIPVNEAMREQFATLHRYADALRRDGIALVVATVPDKARVETQALCGLRQDARLTARWRAWRQALAQAGVAQVDLLGALTAARPAFYRTDVHWNRRGAQAAANAVAAEVQPFLGARGDTRFTVEHESGVRARVGDLLRLAGLADVTDEWRPAPDIEMPETIRPVASGGLLDDTAPAQVLLAGSSFSRRSGFADRLGRALGREVWNVSEDDGRFDRALAAIWEKRASWPSSVRVVIWEMSEDALSAPAAIASGPSVAALPMSTRRQ